MTDIQTDGIPDDLTKLREGVYTSISNPKCIWFVAGEYVDSLGINPDDALVTMLINKVITLFEYDGYTVTVIADEA